MNAYRTWLLPALFVVLALTINLKVVAESEYFDRREAEAKQLGKECSLTADAMLCLTEKGFSCEPEKSNGANAWYCSKELERGKFEAIVVYGEPGRGFRIRWISAD